MFKIPEDMPKWFNKKVEIRESSVQGLGVFATERIEKHEIFERAAVLVFSPSMFKLLRDTPDFNGRNHILHSYTFNWYGGQCALVWGNGSLYNHGNGEAANASYRMQTKIPCVEFYAKRTIEPGEEILIHYVRGQFNIDFCEDGTWMEADVSLARPSNSNALTSLDGDWSDQD